MENEITNPKPSLEVDEVPAFLRARIANAVVGTGGSAPTMIADAAAVHQDDMRRFINPALGKHRMLVRYTVREGMSAVLVPGGHLLFAGVNTPVAQWPDEHEATLKHNLASADEESALQRAQEEFAFEIAKEARRLLIAGFVHYDGITRNEPEPAFEHASVKEVVELIEEAGNAMVMRAVLVARATTTLSVQGLYVARTGESIKPIIKFEVVEAALAAPAYHPETRMEAQTNATAEAISRALAPTLQRIAEVGTPTKGGKS